MVTKPRDLWISCHFISCVSHPDGPLCPPKINQFKARKTKDPFCLLLSCLVPWNDRGAFPKPVGSENDRKSDTTCLESQPCGPGKTLHTEEHM